MNQVVRVFVGAGHATDSCEEYAFAWQDLLSAFGPSAHVHLLPVRGWQALLTEAAGVVSPDQNEPVFLLAHPQLILGPDCPGRLLAALAGTAPQAVAAYDSHHCYPGHPPAYFTVRGLERYVESVADLPCVQPASGAAGPLLVAANSAAVSNGAIDWAKIPRVPSAYVHDFHDYQHGRRDDVLAAVPTRIQRALDVGGGEGRFLEALKAARGCETHLAEYSAYACEQARARVDRVWPGDFLRQNFGERFDCITFLDVLEHTTDGAAWLSRAAELLTEDGQVMASIPNVGHWSVVADLIEGRWDYCPVGIHSVTHLRFFTRLGVVRLFAAGGLDIHEIMPVKIAAPSGFNVSGVHPDLRPDEESLATYSFLVRARRRRKDDVCG